MEGANEARFPIDVSSIRIQILSIMFHASAEVNVSARIVLGLGIILRDNHRRKKIALYSRLLLDDAGRTSAHLANTENMGRPGWKRTGACVNLFPKCPQSSFDAFYERNRERGGGMIQSAGHAGARILQARRCGEARARHSPEALSKENIAAF